jgi:antitoxin component YwqK of YwqJK toxin-antitoxin module
MRIIFVLLFILFYQLSYAQKEFEKIEIQTINSIDTSLLKVLKQEKDQPLILFIWAKKWCSPCIKVLDKIDSNYYQDLQQKHNLKFVALNVDANIDADEIKKFVIDKQWKFDVYKDPAGNYLNKMNIKNAPHTYLIVNNKIITYTQGFTDESYRPEKTADYINHLIESIGSKKIFYDEKGYFTDAENAFFIRTTNFSDSKYEVQNKWSSGELKMIGSFKDKWLTEATGIFKWYYKNGKLEKEATFSSGLLDGILTKWYENGLVQIKEEYNNGILMSILELYANNGEELDKGKLIQGNGFIYRYKDNGKKTSREEYKNGKLHGEYIVYNTNEIEESRHLFNEGVYVKIIEQPIVKKYNAEDLRKIEKSLQKNLIGKQFLGGIYSLPCYNINKIGVNSFGEVLFEGEEKGCFININIKNAEISLEDMKLKIRQSEPKINITFYIENGATVLETFKDLKKILNN